MMRSEECLYRILVVDDEEWIRKGIVTKIKKSNLCFSVIEESSSAKDALNKVREIKPDIIICDIRMKEMDGLELSRTISANFPDVKIIIISGYSEFDYAAEALELGIVDYLVKPIDRYSLFKALKKCIKKIEEEKIIKAKIAAVDYIEKMNNLRIDIGDYFDKKKAIGHIFSDYNEERSVFKCIYIYLDRAVHFTIKEFAEILSKIINLKSFGKDLIIYEDRKNEYVIGFCCDKNCHEIINININSLVDQFRNEMDKRMIIQYTLGISDFGGSFKEVYYQAMNCMKYRILLDEKNVITKKQIQSRNKFIQYNHSLGASIKYNILTGNYEKISKILEDIGNTIKQKDISYSCIQNFYINLLMVALSEINTNLEQRDTIPRDAYVFDTIAQMMNYIKKIYLA
jgi:two-component system response regulator YesN